MSRLGFVFFAILGLLIGWFALAPHSVDAQDFPYAVPQAPEFDESGNALSSSEVETGTPPRKKRSRARQDQMPQEYGSDYRTVRPYVPQDAPPAMQQPAGPRASRGPGYPGPSSAPPPMAAVPPAGPVQDRPDCSQYPMVIARSRSEPEMQMAARQYLTCLLKNGWNMEQAKSQVISTIESTYKLAR
ncbi:MAG: hypothetical protein HY913_21875 [Desulfomonile tiedjei]|nr:hypothetical protein [Desulfomonile tiedjei]